MRECWHKDILTWKKSETIVYIIEMKSKILEKLDKGVNVFYLAQFYNVDKSSKYKI